MSFFKSIFGAKKCEPNSVSYDCGGGTQIVLNKIPEGTFMMGSKKWSSTNLPVHRVTIRGSFYMGIFPVTQAQLEAVMGCNPSSFTENLDRLSRPVDSVIWEEAKMFCCKLSEKTRQQIELPSG